MYMIFLFFQGFVKQILRKSTMAEYSTFWRECMQLPSDWLIYYYSQQSSRHEDERHSMYVAWKVQWPFSPVSRRAFPIFSFKQKISLTARKYAKFNKILLETNK